MLIAAACEIVMSGTFGVAGLMSMAAICEITSVVASDAPGVVSRAVTTERSKFDAVSTVWELCSGWGMTVSASCSSWEKSRFFIACQRWVRREGKARETYTILIRENFAAPDLVVDQEVKITSVGCPHIVVRSV